MSYRNIIIECACFFFVVALYNAPALIEGIRHSHWDAELIAAVNIEDEARYLSKIQEAFEGKWLMANPYFREYKNAGFSPSGFIEWIPVVILRITGIDFATMILLTDILWTAFSIGILRFFLGKVLRNRWAIWGTILVLCMTHFGGEIAGLHRNVTPKFTWPLFGLYLCLLTSSSRRSIRASLLRGSLLGAMFYSYPYHWVLSLITEGVMTMHEAYSRWRMRGGVVHSIRTSVQEFFVVLLPFAVIATPLAYSMRSMLHREEFADFYTRYHIAFTRIPAAPKIQLIVLLAIVVLSVAVWNAKKKYGRTWQELGEEVLPVYAPLVGMMFFLNSNVITGKDPELLGHGGRVILPLVIISYVVAAEKTLSRNLMQKAGIILCIVGLLTGFFHGKDRWTQLHSAVQEWHASDEKMVVEWLRENIAAESVVVAPRFLSGIIPIYTNHYVFFSAGAHFFFVPLPELTNRYLAWIGLYPDEAEDTTTGSLMIFGNHPGAQWSKERTVYELLHADRFSKTQADYIPRQDLRKMIDDAHNSPDPRFVVEKLQSYNPDVLILHDNSPLKTELLKNFTLQKNIGKYRVWVREE